MAEARTLSPPANELPLTESGDYTHAWAAYHDEVASTLSKLGNATTTNDNTSPSQVGYYQEQSSTGAVTLTSGVMTNICQMNIAAGDRDISGNVTFNPAGTTRPTRIIVGLSTISATLQTVRTDLNGAFVFGGVLSIGNGGTQRFSLPSPGGTVYLVAMSSFTVSTMTATGIMWARTPR